MGKEKAVLCFTATTAAATTTANLVIQIVVSPIHRFFLFYFYRTSFMLI